MEVFLGASSSLFAFSGWPPESCFAPRTTELEASLQASPGLAEGLI